MNMPAIPRALPAAAILCALATLAAFAGETPAPLPKPDVAALQKKADDGDPVAQFRLGVLHYEGIHAEFVPEKAIELWTRAAEAGNLDATYRLGLLHHEGMLVDHDPTRAAEFWKKAAGKGHADSVWRLADRYRRACGVDYDTRKYGEELKRAAELGSANAQFDLGSAHRSGSYAPGIPRDEKQAFLWLGKAVDADHHEAKRLLGYYYWNGLGGAEKNPDRALAIWTSHVADDGYENFRRNVYTERTFLGTLYDGKFVDRARQYWEKSAGAGEADAMVMLGYYYAYGMHGKIHDVDFEGRYKITCGGEPDYQKALEWYEKAAQRGHAHAAFTAGLYYGRGLGAGADPVAAGSWTHRAAMLGSEKAWYFMYFYHAEGRGVPRDWSKAMQCLAQAALRGYFEAPRQFRICYEEGRGVPKDPALAERWFKREVSMLVPFMLNATGVGYYKGGTNFRKDHRKAFLCFLMGAENGVPMATYNTGWCYEKGVGVGRSLNTAREYYRKAAAMGYDNARKRLGQIEGETEATLPPEKVPEVF